jgi:transmembrane sensor
VFVGRGSIEVLGTQFDVHQDSSGEERVSVLEGLVRLRGESGAATWHMYLAAGEQAIWAAGSPRTRKLNGASSPTAWRDDRLEFDDQPLPQVVDDLQRYTAVPIEIADKRLLSKHITGAFLVDEPHIRAAVRRLGQWPGVEVRDNGRSLVLTSR